VRVPTAGVSSGHDDGPQCSPGGARQRAGSRRSSRSPPPCRSVSAWSCPSPPGWSSRAATPGLAGAFVVDLPPGKPRRTVLLRLARGPHRTKPLTASRRGPRGFRRRDGARGPLPGDLGVGRCPSHRLGSRPFWPPSAPP
jgi:hypothetical protein